MDQTTTTSGSGIYGFTGLGPGTYRIRQVTPAGRTQTSANPADVVASSGTDATAVDFGSFAGTAISGQAFDDLNGDGVRDAGEPGLAGVTMQLDIGANGTVDQTTTTSGSGTYSFAGLSPGTCRVRQVVPTGRTQTTPDPSDLVVPPGASGIDFGSRVPSSPPSPPSVETQGTTKVEPDDKPDKLTQEQRQQRERTNASNLDEYRTEGNVSGVEQTPDGKLLLVTIALIRDEKLVVQVPCMNGSNGSTCPDVRVGDYLEAEGWQGGKEEQGRFIAEDITVRRNGRRVP